MATVKDISRVFSLYSDRELSIGVREMARRLDLSKSKVQRLAADLAKEGFLRQDEGRQYRLGFRVIELGGLAQLHSNLTEAADPVLRSFVHRTNLNVHLVVLDGLEALCLYRATGSRSSLWNARIGKRAPLHATATGKVLLAHAPPQLFEDVVKQGLRRLTPKTITDPEELRKHLQEVRERGFVVSVDEAVSGQWSAACPIRHSREVVAALGVSMHPSAEFHERTRAIVDELSKAAAQVSERL